ncbi:MAG: type II toxin-antitoxin system HicB family antitoxin [bacterium]
MKKLLKYSIEILPEEDGKGYYVVVPALPGCFSQGKTVEEAKRNVEEAVSLHLAEMKRKGEPIPQEGTGFQSFIEIAA